MVMPISRFASPLDGVLLAGQLIIAYPEIVDRDLADGLYRNPDPLDYLEYFTTAYFHTMEGLAGEVEAVGFDGPIIFAAEGPGWPLQEQWSSDPQCRRQTLFAVRAVETEPSLMGFSHHLVAAGTKV